MTKGPFERALVRKGKRALKVARLALNAGDNNSAVSRSYYVMFNFAQAALLRAGTLLRYSLALIDLSSSLDNGRVVGYDNAHGQHHRHYFGRVDRVEFESYEKLESQFEAQVRQYLETGTC